MKIKVSELEGAQLDYFIAKGIGFDKPMIRDKVCYQSSTKHRASLFSPSTNDKTAREFIEWVNLNKIYPSKDWCKRGELAAMRAYVASKFGDEVEVPE